MKKWTTYLWLGLYSVLTLGIQINLHSCSDQLKTIGLWKEADCCHHDMEAHAESQHAHAHCGDQQDEGCCSDQNFEISIDEEHVVSKILRVEAAFLLVHLPVSKYQYVVWPQITDDSKEARAGPPPIVCAKRYERFQQRITYG